MATASVTLEQRICRTCSETKLLTEFHHETTPRGALTYRRQCKACHALACKAWRTVHRYEHNASKRAYTVTHREQIAAAKHIYYAAHREEILATRHIYHTTHQDKRLSHNKAYQLLHRARLAAAARSRRAAHAARYAAANRAYHTAHKEERNAQARAYHATHKAEHAAYYKDWVATHKEERRVYENTRRARKQHAPITDLTAHEWRMIKAHYNYCCVYCGDKATPLTQDHIVPLSKGGSHTKTNIVPACRRCNSKKGTGAPLRTVELIIFPAPAGS